MNGTIARNLLRLAALLEDDKYRTLARQTCNAFSIEIMQHPFLFVGLLDAIVGLELGIRNVTGVLCTSDTSESTVPLAEGVVDKADEKLSGKDLVIKKVRAEAGLAASTSTATVALVDVRPSTAGADGQNKSVWLKNRNPLFKDLKPGTPPKNFLLVCEVGSCRTVDL